MIFTCDNYGCPLKTKNTYNYYKLQKNVSFYACNLYFGSYSIQNSILTGDTWGKSWCYCLSNITILNNFGLFQ